jgi:hypothetical protein
MGERKDRKPRLTGSVLDGLFYLVDMVTCGDEQDLGLTRPFNDEERKISANIKSAQRWLRAMREYKRRNKTTE